MPAPIGLRQLEAVSDRQGLVYDASAESGEGAYVAAPHKTYPSSDTDPVSPTPADGDLYYNTVLDMWMAYDSSRSKWLSVTESTIDFGRSGNTAAGSYYRHIDGQAFSATVGRYAEFNGTVVSLGYTRSDTDSATFEVTAGGTGIAALVSTATGGKDVALDGDFSANQILGVRNQSGGSATTSVAGWVRIRWRV